MEWQSIKTKVGLEPERVRLRESREKNIYPSAILLHVYSVAHVSVSMETKKNNRDSGRVILQFLTNNYQSQICKYMQLITIATMNSIAEQQTLNGKQI